MLRRLAASALLFLLVSISASSDPEGSALLRFRELIEDDPYGVFGNWTGGEVGRRCLWFGVDCDDHGRVVAVNLNDLCLKGTLSPELGKLAYLKSIILSKNLFYGTIPGEFGDLQELQVLDLEHNNLSGPLPSKLDRILSLNILVIGGNKLLNNLSTELHDLTVFPELQVNREPLSLNRGSPSRNENSAIRRFLRILRGLKGKPHGRARNHASSPEPTPSPLASPAPSPAKNSPSRAFPSGPRSGTSEPSHPPSDFTPSLVPHQHPQSHKKPTLPWPAYTVGAVLSLMSLSAIYIFCWRVNKVVTVMPWSTGLSGQLQKAFVTGVPSLKRSELERACEDFSNVIGSLSDCMLYKGTLSSGIEIAVTSTMIALGKDWSTHSEAQFRKKISVMSKVNHKNFMSLLGYSEEEEPFTRMMVFEYAPNGTLFEHLHIKEAEHLEWASRLRIAMGIAYCLEYMHRLDPPVVLGNLNSSTVYLSDDFAAMVSDLVFWNYETEPAGGSGTAPLSNPQSIVYKFGIILLELVSGRRPFSDDDGLLVLYASSYLTGQRPMREMVDPTLESFPEEDVIALCQVIQPCINPDPEQRPSMTEIVRRLRIITAIAPDGAVPKLSPLWWAELEIQSGEGS